MGERVLVTGAAGGVGTAGVQLAAATGAVVVATVRDPARRAAVAALGADEVVAPGDEADARALRRRARTRWRARACRWRCRMLATGGRVVVIGVGGGGTYGARPVHAHGEARPHRRLDAARPQPEEKATWQPPSPRHVLPLLAAGRITVPV